MGSIGLLDLDATLLLGATRRCTIATDVAPIRHRDAVASADARVPSTRPFGRFPLGLGVSRKWLVEDVRGDRYAAPLAAMRAHLDVP